MTPRLLLLLHLQPPVRRHPRPVLRHTLPRLMLITSAVFRVASVVPPTRSTATIPCAATDAPTPMGASTLRSAMLLTMTWRLLPHRLFPPQSGRLTGTTSFLAGTTTTLKTTSFTRSLMFLLQLVLLFCRGNNNAGGTPTTPPSEKKTGSEPAPYINAGVVIVAPLPVGCVPTNEPARAASATPPRIPKTRVTRARRRHDATHAKRCISPP